MKKILDYLSDLMDNNEREWFQSHKKERDEANAEFESLIQDLIFKIGEVDPAVLKSIPKELTFKPVRDTRFSTDKTPYNPSMRAHIGPMRKLPIPVGYYLMIMPGNHSFLGGGLFADVFKDATDMIRDYIVDHGDELNEIVNRESFKKYFVVRGVALKNVPKGYNAESPYAEWLKYKCLYLEYAISDQDLLTDNLVEKMADIFIAMKPFNDFLNRALKDFKMPERS